MTQAAPPASVPTGALHREAEEIGADVMTAVRRVIERGWYVLGSEVKEFELAFADYLGIRHAIGVASGTDAITLAIAALDIGPGDEVVIPAMTSVATAIGVINAGASPVLADIDPITLSIDPDHVAAVLTSRTKAIVPVHLYGRPAPMAQLMDLARTRGLAVVEDACQAHGASVRGRKAGTIGTAGCFSFYPSKNLGAYGDGGAVVSNDTAIAERVRLLRQYGWRTRDHSEIRGWNSRLDEIQASILRVKLPRLDSWNDRRRHIASVYNDAFRDLRGLQLPPNDEGHCWHLYPVRAADRDELRRYLAEHGIETAIHYPVPIQAHPGITGLVVAGECPNAARAAETLVSLPIFPHLTELEVERVVSAVRSYFTRDGATG